MAAKRGFPWRWLIASLAIAVVVITLILPPPGSEDEAQEAPEQVADSTVVDVPPAVPESVPDTVRVLVLNGTGIDGLAGRTQRVLLRSSSDSTVILAPFDPADTEFKPYAETIIISHLPGTSSAMLVADILGRPHDCIVWEVPSGEHSAPQVDVTVCLGEDIENDIPDIE